MIRIFFLSFLALLLGGVIAAGLGFYISHGAYVAAGPLMDERVVTVAPGRSVRAVSRQLAAADVIRSPYLFEAVIRLQDDAPPIQAGEYKFVAGQSMEDVVAQMRAGQVLMHRITIPEGLTVKQIMALLENQEALRGDIVDIPAEGSLLPETYNFARGYTRQQLINKMKRAHDIALDRLWQERADNLPYKTKGEALTMASIVERETGVASERAKVAGVFVNRLRRGMQIQSDPTTIYALSDGLGVLDRPLYRSDWKLAHPYNTYYIAGLPPGPIANPGLESIHAALNPEDHKYLYFVADGTGGHAFAKSLEGHNQNVANWRKVKSRHRESRQGKSL